MAWDLIRVVLFGGAFLVGTVVTHSTRDQSLAPIPVVAQTKGTSVVITCDDGTVMIGPSPAQPNSVKLHCLQSGMVIVRDLPKPENPPVFKPAHAYIQ
jgi:hypothetical protein